MEPLGSFPRVLNVLPREKIEGPPRDFLKANPRPNPSKVLRPVGMVVTIGRDMGLALLSRHGHSK